MKKKAKEALLGYLNNIEELYSLYAQDSWSDEDFTTGAITDWTLDIMEVFISHTDVVPVLKLVRETINEGTRISKLPHNDDWESEDMATFDRLEAEIEKLKERIKHL